MYHTLCKRSIEVQSEVLIPNHAVNHCEALAHSLSQAFRVRALTLNPILAEKIALRSLPETSMEFHEQQSNHP